MEQVLIVSCYSVGLKKKPKRRKTQTRGSLYPCHTWFGKHSMKYSSWWVVVQFCTFIHVLYLYIYDSEPIYRLLCFSVGILQIHCFRNVRIAIHNHLESFVWSHSSLIVLFAYSCKIEKRKYKKEVYIHR